VEKFLSNENFYYGGAKTIALPIPRAYIYGLVVAFLMHGQVSLNMPFEGKSSKTQRGLNWKDV
jgi:hypothetical protein